MIVVDQLYGAVALPNWLKPLFISPELQRLREVRLINTSSPSCSSLSDVRRFTHTIGVLHLLSQAEQSFAEFYSAIEIRALQVATLLHDIGTPPFGHLFEYQLAAIKGWHHEDFVLSILRGTYRPEKRYHQIYFGNTLSLFERLRELDIDIDLVSNIISGNIPLGKVLAGSIDVDNIDNVYRMSALLGLNPSIDSARLLAKSIVPKEDGVRFKRSAVTLINQWQSNRKNCYKVLAFDDSCLSGQSMLTNCISLGLEKGLLNEEHWFFTDEQLLRYLADVPENKATIQRFVVGDFFDTLFIGWYSQPKGEVDFRAPDRLQELSNRLSDQLRVPCYPYVFYDSGTFSKKLTIDVENSSSSNEIMEFGYRSESSIIGVFTSHHVSSSECRRLRIKCIAILEDFGFSSATLTPIPDKQEIYGVSSQGKLPI